MKQSKGIIKDINRINSSFRVRGLSSTTDDNGNVYILGQFFKDAFSNNIFLTNDQSGIFLAQANKNGQWRWASIIHIHSSFNDVRMSCDLICNRKNLYAAMVISNVETGVTEGLVVKTNLGGNINYKTIITGELVPTIRLSIDRKENVYIVNSYIGLLNLSDSVKLSSNSSNNQNTRGYIAKLDKNGEWLWARDISDDGDNNNSILNDIITKPDGNSYVTGLYIGNLDKSLRKCRNQKQIDLKHFILAKIETNGKWIHIKSFPNGIGTGLDIDQNENIYVTGGFIHNMKLDRLCSSSHGTNLFVSKINRHFKALWITTTKYDTNIFNGNINIAVADENIYIDGPFFKRITFGQKTLKPKQGLNNKFVAKLLTNGCWSWSLRISGGENSTSKDLSVNNFNQIYVTGGFRFKLVVKNRKEFTPITSLFVVKIINT